MPNAPDKKQASLMRLPFFYGWIIVAVTFVTMAIGVTARTSRCCSADHRVRLGAGSPREPFVWPGGAGPLTAG